MTQSLQRFFAFLLLNTFLLNTLGLHQVYAAPTELAAEIDPVELATFDTPESYGADRTTLLANGADQYAAGFGQQVMRLHQSLSGTGPRLHELDPFGLMTQTPDPEQSDKETAYINARDKLKAYKSVRAQNVDYQNQARELLKTLISQKEQLEAQLAAATDLSTAQLNQLTDLIEANRAMIASVQIDSAVSTPGDLTDPKDILESKEMQEARKLDLAQWQEEIARQEAALAKLKAIAYNNSEIELMEQKERQQAFEETLAAINSKTEGQLKRNDFHNEALKMNKKVLKEQIYTLKKTLPHLEQKVKDKLAKYTNTMGDRIKLNKLKLIVDSKSVILMQDDYQITRFDFEVHSAKIIDGYLVFFSKNKFDAENKVQHIELVDLNYYRAALGRKLRVPKFLMPIKTEQELKSHADQPKLDKKSLQIFGDVQIIAWNLLVNLLDPSTYKTTAPILDSLVGIFEKAMGMAVKQQNEIFGHENSENEILEAFGQEITSQLNFVKNDQAAQSKLSPEAKQAINGLGEAEVRSYATKKFLQNFLYMGKMMSYVKANAANHKEQQKLGARIRLMWNSLTPHRPLGSPTVIQSLTMMAAGMVKPLKGLSGGMSEVTQGAYQLSRHPYIRLGGAVASAALIGEFVNPPAFHSLLFSAVDTVTTGLDMLIGKVQDVAYLAGQSWHATTAGLNPVTFHQAYFADEDIRYKFGVGLAALFVAIYTAIAIPHMLVNSIGLAKDFSEMDLKAYENKLRKFKADELEELREEMNRGPSPDPKFLERIAEVEAQQAREAVAPQPLGRLSIYKFWFIQREKNIKSEYLQSMAMAEASRHQGLAEEKKITFNAQEEKVVEEFLLKQAQLEEQSILGRVIRTVKTLPGLRSFFEESKNVRTFGSALKEFIFGWSSITNSLRAYTKFWWEGYFVFRTYVMWPRLGFNSLLFPKYYSVAMKNHNQKRVTMPTELNGGRVHALEVARRVFLRVAGTKLPYTPDGPFTAYFDNKVAQLNDLNAWEEKVLLVEEALQPFVLKKATEALIKHLSETDPLGSAMKSVTQNGGIKSLTDMNAFGEKGAHSFFVNYFEKLMEESMKVILEYIASHEGTLKESIPDPFSIYDVDKEMREIEAKLGQQNLAEEVHLALIDRIGQLRVQRDNFKETSIYDQYSIDHGAIDAQTAQANVEKLAQMDAELADLRAQVSALKRGEVAQTKKRTIENDLARLRAELATLQSELTTLQGGQATSWASLTKSVEEQNRKVLDKERELAAVGAELAQILVLEGRLAQLQKTREEYNRAAADHSARDLKGDASLLNYFHTPDHLTADEKRTLEGAQSQEVKDVAEFVVDKASRRKNIFQEVTALMSKTFDLQRMAVNFKYTILSMMDPKNNRQIARVMAVRRQLEKPEAMNRAARAAFVENLVDKPQELIVDFIALAGVMIAGDEFLRPIMNEMFGDNSWFYLNRYTMFSGYIVGTITSLLAAPGLKLMADEMHDNDFGEVPEGEDARKGFVSYMWKNFNAPNNTLWQNQWHQMNLCYTNLFPYFVNTTLLSLMALGYVNMNAFVVGLFFSYLTPLMGFANKVEQSIELSMGYFLKDIDGKLRAHPKVQEWYLKKTTRVRMVINIFYKWLYENPVGFLSYNMQLMGTEKLGSFSFLRIVFGGQTPEEMAGKVAGYLKGVASLVPGLGVLFARGVDGVGSVYWRSGVKRATETENRSHR